MSRNQKYLVSAGLFISVFFLWFAFRDLHPEAVLDNIRQVQAGWVLLSLPIFAISIILIALRWQFLLRSIVMIPLRTLLSLVCIGYMGNNVYPLRSGEALRVFLLYRNHKVPVIKAATTIVVERVFDGLVLLTFIVIPLLVVDIASNDVRRVVEVAAPLFVVLLAIFFALAARPDLLRRVVKVASRLLPGKVGQTIGKLSEDVLAGLEGLRTPTDLAGTVISSYATWAVQGIVYWMVAYAMDIDTSFAVMLVVVGAVNLAGLIPASPGQIGVFEFFVSAVLVGAGIAEARAAAYALVAHIVIWLPPTLIGFFLLAREGMSWRSITQARDLEEQAAVEA